MSQTTPPPLLIKKLTENARLPTRGSAFAAGYDLYASEETVIKGRGKGLVETGLSMATPAGTCMSLHLVHLILHLLHQHVNLQFHACPI